MLLLSLCGTFVVKHYASIDTCLSLLLFLFTASGTGDKLASVCSELEQLRESADESLEQSLVRRGEMTPFGTVLNNASEVNIWLLLLLHYVLFNQLST